MITVNIIKAREIKRDALRAERAPLLEKLDVEAMRVISDQAALSNVEARKQLLRDAPASVDLAMTVDELKAISLPSIGIA